MGCYKMPKECDVSGRKESSTLLNVSERSSNLRPENRPLGSAKWRVPASPGTSATVRPEWFEERARGWKIFIANAHNSSKNFGYRKGVVSGGET